MEKNPTLFAFKLAANKQEMERQDETTVNRKWQPCDHVAIAGCTRFGRWDVRAYGLLGVDSGLSC